MAVTAISRDDAIDAEFETLAPRKPIAASPPPNGPLPGVDQLDLLRRAFEPVHPSSHPDALSPAFIIFTLIAALVVFWVSGGHSLLY